MGSYFIAMNRSTEEPPKENYEIFRDGLYASKLFHKVMGDAESYLDSKKMARRLQWSKESHEHIYENDWVVDILPGNDEYDLGVRTKTIAEGAGYCDFRYSKYK